MKIILLSSVLVMAALVAFGLGPNFYDDFDSVVPYSEGQQFVNATNGWHASGMAAYVTSNGALAGKAAVMGELVTLTNTLSAPANQFVWTDFWMKPTLGVEDPNPQTNASSFLCYFNSNGIVSVATGSVWVVCTNDVWGNPVKPATNNAYVRLSVFQDYSTSNQAVFLDDQLILQDVRFMGTPATYSRLVVQNSDNSCWLDNVWIKTNYDVAALTNNFNGDGMADAQEVNTYGYARRTLYVSRSATNLVPLFPGITNALAAWRPRDTIHVIAGDYSGEAVRLAANPSNVVFEGDAFAVSSLTVASNAWVSLGQSVSCGTLTVSGQVVMAGGASLTSSTASVAGLLAVSTNGAFVVTNLAVAGTVTFTTNAQLVAVSAGVTMNGPFAISNNVWDSGGVVSMPLPFSDSFDPYAEGTVVTNLKFRGWYASDGSVKVQSLNANSGKAVILPDGTVLSNCINSADTRIWTDFMYRPVLGIEPLVPETNKSSFLAYANSNGYLVVATVGGGWYSCSNQLNNVAPPLLGTNVYRRISVCQDFNANPRTFAVFVDGNLVAQGLGMPAGTINRYSSFIADNREGTTYVDDVLITTVLPAGLTNDLDGDGFADAYEIHNYGLTALWPRGSVFKIR